MSSPPATHDSRASTASDSAERQDRSRGTLERISPTLAKPIRRIGFWIAIVLPVVYVPFLVTGLSTASETVWFLGLLTVNLVALYVGHAYHQ